MGWQRGEVWLGTDVLWGDGGGAPAVAGFSAPTMPSLSSIGLPPGLIASRQRREAKRRHRDTRKARATALVLSPAVIFPIAAFRSSGADGAPLAEDPPTMTFRISTESVRAALQPAGLKQLPDTVGIARRPVPERKRSAPRGHAVPKIAWHDARSVGLPFSGSLIDGTPLPTSGPNWVSWDPVTDSVPNEPRRLYGNDRTIRAIVTVSGAYRAANKNAPRIVVGDISRAGGGPMTDEHVSHQNGLDADIYYPRLDRKLRAPTKPSQIDLRLSQDLVDRFVAAGAQMIFVGFSTGLHGPSGVVIPYANHENHMHVRFPQPG